MVLTPYHGTPSPSISSCAGDLRFDPLGLKPKDAAAMKAMATKEINNGRLAMVAVIGIIVQELVTGKNTF
jgi:hypothetical protein